MLFVLTVAHHTVLLYYEYGLTLDLERRLFWSQRSFRQWGSALFFLNRYCGIIGHIPFVIQKLSGSMSPLYPLCSPVHPYRQILVFVTQIIIGCMSLLDCQHIILSQRLGSLINSDLHHEDLRLVRQKPRSAHRANLTCFLCHCG